MPRPPVVPLVVALAFAAAACKPKEAAGEPREAALPVDIVLLEPKPVRDTSEYLATLSSRSSVALYPQIVGHVSKILVRPGERVKAGAPLVLIDPSQPQATLDQLVATRELKQASLHNAEGRARRAASLFEGGLMSRQDFDQARSDRDVAAADVKAADAQTKAQASQLRFFTVAAPFDGVVGDIPVKLGDLVTTATKVTTVDQNALLEAYVNVPVERASEIEPGSRIEILDARGALLGESPVTFTADQASVDTQSVLIKGAFVNAGALRAAQYVRARMVWRTRPGLRLPTIAVVRQSGQTFAFVAEGEGAGVVARQRGVTLGAIDGNEYVVTAGLKAGERVIVSSVQKLRDGGAVSPGAATSPALDGGAPALQGLAPMFIDFFIRRPVFATVCAILITLVGAVSIPSLPIAQYPNLALPQVAVSAFYNGASAEVVESAVTTPLELAINGVPGMKYMDSSSGNDGSSNITVTFEVGRDIDVAAVDVQNRVSSAQGRLPNEVKQTGVVITKNSGSFVLAAALFTDDERYDQMFISNYADVFMRDALKRVPGVSDVQVFGERKFSMRIWLDPTRLAARQLTAIDVVNALLEQNVQVAAGAVGLPPAPTGQSYQLSVRAKGRLVEPGEFEDIVLRTTASGELVRVRDVGRAELGAEGYANFLRFDGKKACGLGITQLPGANALDVADRVKAELSRLSRTFPPGLRYRVAFDTTLAVSESIREVLITLGEAIVLVILVIFVFLQSLRVTVIPAVTIPVSLIGTFAFVKLFNFSINTLTLFGITLATGLVVDDAIVVVENVSRFIEEKGLGPREAAAEGVREVFGAVIATSLVLVAVFVPVSFFPGTTGRIYQQFSLTIAFSVGISTFNSLTLSPALGALLLRAVPEHKSWFFRGVDGALGWMRRRYGAALGVLLRFRPAVLLVFVACLGGTYALSRRVPVGFVPEEDQGYFIAIVQGPEGSSLSYTEGVVAEAEAILAKQPEIEGVFSVGGFSFGGSGPNKGILFVNLKPWDERRGAEHSAEGIVGRLRGPLGGLKGAVVLPFAPPSIQGVGNFGGFQFELEDQSGQGRLDDLALATTALMTEGNRTPALRGVFSTFTANDPQLVVDLDRPRTKALGVSVSDVFTTLQVMMGSAYVNDFDFNNRIYRVYVQADQPFRANPRDLSQLYVRAASGAMVPLGGLLKVDPGTTASTINHYNLFRSTEINGSPAEGVSSGEAMAAMEAVAGKALPRGMGFEWSGISREQIESGGKAVAIFGLGLLFVFLVLAAQYESFALPFVVILSVPVAVAGALGAALLRGYSNDVFCQVGLVMLIGLASKNAILIVEFANQLRERGKPLAVAAIEAAETRLRPILMTSSAFLLGASPLLVATGAGSGSRHSLGTAVFGGMLVSTVMNLFFIPVLYVVVETARERLLRRRSPPEELSAAAPPPRA